MTKDDAIQQFIANTLVIECETEEDQKNFLNFLGKERAEAFKWRGSDSLKRRGYKQNKVIECNYTGYEPLTLSTSSIGYYSKNTKIKLTYTEFAALENGFNPYE